MVRRFLFGLCATMALLHAMTPPATQADEPGKCPCRESAKATAIGGLRTGAKFAVEARLEGEFRGISGNMALFAVKTNIDTEQGVPILSKVPYVSRLFKNVGRVETEVIVAIPREHITSVQPIGADAIAQSQSCPSQSCPQPWQPVRPTLELTSLTPPCGPCRLKVVAPARLPHPIRVDAVEPNRTLIEQFTFEPASRAYEAVCGFFTTCDGQTCCAETKCATLSACKLAACSEGKACCKGKVCCESKTCCEGKACCETKGDCRRSNVAASGNAKAGACCTANVIRSTDLTKAVRSQGLTLKAGVTVFESKLPNGITIAVRAKKSCPAGKCEGLKTPLVAAPNFAFFAPGGKCPLNANASSKKSNQASHGCPLRNCPVMSKSFNASVPVTTNALAWFGPHGPHFAGPHGPLPPPPSAPMYRVHQHAGPHAHPHLSPYHAPHSPGHPYRPGPVVQSRQTPPLYQPAPPKPAAPKPDESLMEEMVTLAVENAELRAQAEARDELAEERAGFIEAIVEAQVENARLEAKLEMVDAREELLQQLVETMVEKARLEGYAQSVEERAALAVELAQQKSTGPQSPSDVDQMRQALLRFQVENQRLQQHVSELRMKVLASAARTADRSAAPDLESELNAPR